MAAIGNLVASYWSQNVAESGACNPYRYIRNNAFRITITFISGESSTAAVISASTFMDAVQKLGDHQGDLTGVVIHSATKTVLKKQNLITTIRPSDSAEFEVFQDLHYPVVDDGCPVPSTGVYTTYIFGNGALALGNGVNSAITQTETARDALAGDDILVNRKAFVLHPRGVKFNNTSVAGAAPTNAELETATGTDKGFDTKRSGSLNSSIN